jgi:hypothetical protein
MSPLSVKSDEISKTNEQQHPVTFIAKCLRVQNFNARRFREEIIKTVDIEQLMN